MKRKAVFAGCVACLLAFAAETCTGAIPLRGVVEGFYGRPWTQEERLEQLAFMERQGLNVYIYAPKDDVYHRQKWREPYPEAEQKKLRELIEEAQRRNVEFVFALSPGLDLHLQGEEKERDIAILIHKFSSVYAMGVRRFALFFDDIEDKSGSGQAEVINRVSRELKRLYADVKPFFTVPTEYFSADMMQNGVAKEYTQSFAESLDRDILVLYTGEGVVCEGVSLHDLQRVNTLYQRKMALWWNYPVSDYQPEKLALGPIVNMENSVEEELSAFLMNPMEHAQLSKIALQTGAVYASKPHLYQPDEAWRKAIREQYGELADDMLLFADHSQRMENSWAHTGRQDGVSLRAEMDTLWQLVGAHKPAAGQLRLLDTQFTRLEQAAKRLSEHLPDEKRHECANQLALLEKLADGGRTAVAALKAHLLGERAAKRRLQRELAEKMQRIDAVKDAKLSEETLEAFLNETADFLEGRDALGKIRIK